MWVGLDNNSQCCLPHSSITGAQKRPISFGLAPRCCPHPGIIPSSCHQLGVSTTCPCHSTHFSYSSTGGSVGKWLPASSSHSPTSPWKNCSTLGPNSEGGPRLNSASSSSHCGGICAGELAGLLSGRSLWHPPLCLWDLLLHWSQLWKGAWASGWPLVRDQLSCSIFSSKVMVVARALQWASLTLASWILASPLSPWGSA